MIDQNELLQKGIEDSKLAGKVFDELKIKFSWVVSSPSCRSRETAIYATKRIDQIEPSILHRTAQKPSQHKQYARKLRDVLDNIKLVNTMFFIISTS